MANSDDPATLQAAIKYWSDFEKLVRQGIGRRLTYRALTAKDDAGFMGIE